MSGSSIQRPLFCRWFARILLMDLFEIRNMSWSLPQRLPVSRGFAMIWLSRLTLVNLTYELELITAGCRWLAVPPCLVVFLIDLLRLYLSWSSSQHVFVDLPYTYNTSNGSFLSHIWVGVCVHYEYQTPYAQHTLQDDSWLWKYTEPHVPMLISLAQVGECRSHIPDGSEMPSMDSVTSNIFSMRLVSAGEYGSHIHDGFEIPLMDWVTSGVFSMLLVYSVGACYIPDGFVKHPHGLGNLLQLLDTFGVLCWWIQLHPWWLCDAPSRIPFSSDGPSVPPEFSA